MKTVSISRPSHRGATTGNACLGTNFHAEPASTVITPPATQSRPQLDDEKERLRLERDAARRELEALRAQLAAQQAPAPSA